MKSQKKIVFITGVAGFIGFHLASFLIKRGDYVIGCDNFNNYYSPNLKKKRAAHLRSLGVDVIEQDIQTLMSLPENVSHVVHLAAQAGVRYSITHPQPYADSNLDGFLKVLECCRHTPNVKLIFASSSSVYGGNTKTPFSETDPTDSPVSLYAATKKAGELMAKSYHHLYGIPMTGLRFFTVYGPWGRPDMAYFSFAEKILKGEAIPVFNQGKMERDFTYIDDIIQGTVKALDHCQGFEIYNLGNNQPEPLMHLIKLLETHLGKKAVLDFLPMQKGDVKTTFADIQKASSAFGYAPTTSLDEGIGNFSLWFLNQSSILTP
ncbi:MAG: NAD-dependent epimerase/dehydratase family protein [Chlamydiia bacterium]|nr:NAD-dependent epimerase/dehydratase family protein [Chlamydiia bacterium]